MVSVDSLDSVLVLGGCGFLGHHIIQKLLDADNVSQVTAFDTNIDSHQVQGARYLVGSITSSQNILKALHEAKPNVIFYTISPQALGAPKLFIQVNVEDTRTLLECIQQCDFVKAIVYTSSSSVIHDNRSDIAGVTEDAPVLFFPQQPEIYSCTRALAEQMILRANNIGGVRTCAIRPAGMFGEGDRTTAGNIIGSAKEGKNKYQIGDNSKLFDWTYVGNNADAQLLAARAFLRSSVEKQPPDRKVDGEAFVITNDDPWPFWDFTRALGRAAGYPIEKEHVYIIPAALMWIFVAITEWLYWCFTFGTKQPRYTRAKVKYMTTISCQFPESLDFLLFIRGNVSIPLHCLLNTIFHADLGRIVQAGFRLGNVEIAMDAIIVNTAKIDCAVWKVSITSRCVAHLKR